MISAAGSRSFALRALVIGLLATSAAALLVAGLAYACTPQAFISSLSASSGTAGSTVTLRGSAFNRDQTMRVLWNSASGKQLGPTTTTNSTGDFAVTFAIPADATPGQHTLVAAALDDYTASTSFTVVAPTAPATAGDGGGTANAAPAASQTAQPAPAAQAAPAPAAKKPTPSTRPERFATGTQQAARRPAQPAPKRDTAVAQSGGAADAVDSAPAQSSTPATTAARQPAATPPERSRGTSATSAPASKPRTFDSGTRAATPSTASAGGDVWSGFDSSDRPSLSTGGSAMPSAESPSGLTIGVGILGVGMLLLLGGFAVAEARRRRARVSSR